MRREPLLYLSLVSVATELAWIHVTGAIFSAMALIRPKPLNEGRHFDDPNYTPTRGALFTT